MTTFLIILAIVAFLAAVAACIFVMMALVRRNKELQHNYEEAEVRATHWNKQFNALMEGSDGAWARVQRAQIEALEQGLDEAIDDHAQEQASWADSRIQYEATIDDLKAQVNSLSGQRDALQHELQDVQQTALEMQIDLTRGVPPHE